jgi:4-hydroxy-tetrahydrodipicolinate synthase
VTSVLAFGSGTRENTGAMTDLLLRGCFTALVTPFLRDGSAVDWEAYEALLESQVEGGVQGVIPLGTTGEPPTLSEDEKAEVVKRTVRLLKGRAQIVVGTGTNSTADTIASSRAAVEAGVDGVMLVMPYYNRPNQEGLFRHVQLVAGAVSAPIVLYNHPGRTGVNLEVETLERILQACPNVVGLKDASGNVLYCQSLARQRDRIAVLSGDDVLTVPLMSVGATGVVSVTSNLYPKEIGALVQAMLSGDWKAAQAAHLRHLALYNALFCEPSPAPIKAALALRGRMHATVRSPMAEISDQGRSHISRVIDAFEGR